MWASLEEEGGGGGGSVTSAMDQYWLQCGLVWGKTTGSVLGRGLLNPESALTTISHYPVNGIFQLLILTSQRKICC